MSAAREDAELKVRFAPEDRMLRRPAGRVRVAGGASTRPSSRVAVAQARARARLAMEGTATATERSLRRAQLDRDVRRQALSEAMLKVNLRPALDEPVVRLRNVGDVLPGRKLTPRSVALLLRQLLDPRCASVGAIKKALRDGGYEVAK